MTSSGRLAPIETLPVELLQRVFFESLEFNLPRASLPIARALSSHVVFTWLIRLAFSSENSSSDAALFVIPFLPFDYFGLSDDQRTALQTEVLKCRWCTVQLVRQCQREYVENVLNRKGADLVLSETDTMRLRNGLQHGWGSVDAFDLHNDRARRSRGDLVISTQLRAANEHGTGEDPEGESDNGRRKLAIWFNLGAVQIREPRAIIQQTDVFRLPCVSNVSDPCRMPDRLLCPPWTEDKLQLLALFSTEAYIDDIQISRSKKVLRQLILDREYVIFERLLSLQIRVKGYAYPLRWPVGANIFRLAARSAESSDDDPFLRLLFLQHRDDIPPKDSSIRTLMQRYDRRTAR